MSVAVEGVIERRAWTNLVPLPFIAGLLSLALLPRIQAIPRLEYAFQAATALLSLWYVAVLLRARLRHQALAIEFKPMPTHYVQAIVQCSVYLYWATAWPFIAGQFALIVGQWCFAYVCTILLAWSRRDRCDIGFGPLPIILSTNFFLCFRDEWFYLQFLMIAVGIFGKEFIRWNRDGRSTHIFNPSVLGLSIFSLCVILTGSTGLTWAQQNATELGRPEYIYLWIFGVGLIVQFLFEVTLVTMTAAVTLALLNLIYTAITGIYWFLDAGIPIAVFLGLHLLVTDPATSPRNNYGRALFGALYGGGVFMLYATLEWAGVPRFYDKLLLIPVLNLLVPLIDRYARGSRLATVSPFSWISSLTRRRQNLLYMGTWVAAFAALYSMQIVGPDHPGKHVEFWKSACAKEWHNACRNLRAIDEDDCYAGHLSACYELAATDGARGFPVDPVPIRALAYAHACDLGDQSGCQQFATEYRRGAEERLKSRCDSRDARSCYALGLANLMALGTDPNREAAFREFARGCDLRSASACGNLAETYRFGVGTPQAWPQALAAYDRACSLGYSGACLRLGNLYADGDHVRKDLRRAAGLFERVCRFEPTEACEGNFPGARVAD